MAPMRSHNSSRVRRRRGLAAIAICCSLFAAACSSSDPGSSSAAPSADGAGTSIDGSAIDAAATPDGTNIVGSGEGHDQADARPDGLPMVATDSVDATGELPQLDVVPTSTPPEQVLDLEDRLVDVGTGAQAVKGSTILVSWVMTDLSTGEVVDDSEQFGGEVQITVGQGMLPAPVDDAIVGLPLGSTVRVVIEPGEARLAPHLNPKATHEVVLTTSERDPFED